MSRVVPFALAGTIGVISGSVMAGILEPITFGVFAGSVAVGVGVALGVGAAGARGAKKSAAALMDTIRRTMASMGEWKTPSEAGAVGPGLEEKQGEKAGGVARNIEQLQALQDRRLASGPQLTIRRVSFSIALGASLGALLPVLFRFFPWEYPLPWMIAGFLGWLLVKTVRSLFRGIGEKKVLDKEIEALLESNAASSLEPPSEEAY